MLKHLIKAFQIILLSSIFSLPHTVVLASDVVDEKATKQELSQIKKQITSLKRTITRTQGRRTKTETELRAAELDISQTHKKLNTVNRNLNASTKAIARLKKEQKKLNTAKNRQTKALLSDIAASYQSGKQEYIKLLLNHQNPEKLARTLKYYEYFHQARLGNIETFNNTLAQIQRNQTTTATELKNLKHFKEQLETDKALLTKAQARRKKVIAKLNQSLKSKDAKLKHFKSSETDLTTLLKAVQETLADLPAQLSSTPFATRKGKLKWPIKGRVIKRFGNRRVSGKLRWNGIVIKARQGTAIKAVHRGRVVFSDWLRGFGLLTIIDHSDGYLSLYGHNRVLNKEPGDWVENGEIIAYSGSNTEQTMSGLYFELRHQRKPINPSKWLKK